MARYTGPVCRLCRREGEKLFLKGKRCFTEKCAIERRAFPPGEHGGGRRRRRQSEYAVQLREKQKVKRIYGVAEKQFRTLFKKASRVPGVTGENLLVALESRLDNIVYRLGFAPSRKAARQLIRHRHVRVEGATVDVPSFSVSPGAEVSVARGPGGCRSSSRRSRIAGRATSCRGSESTTMRRPDGCWSAHPGRTFPWRSKSS